MKAIISRRLLSPILLIGSLSILPSPAPHARASEAEPRGSSEEMPPGLHVAVSAAIEREERNIYAVDSTGSDAGATRAGDRLAETGKTEDAVPEGLTDSDWKSIRREYERHRHAAVAVDGEFRARNPGQQWLTHFDGRGFTVEPAIAGVEPEAAGWRWGLELQSYGFPGHQRAVRGQAKMTAQNDRVTYDWDAGLREWFVNDRSGLEHGYTLVSRPPGVGDPQLGAGYRLELRLAVRGGLRAQGHADGRGVSFVNEQGHAVVHYTGLKVWDADNRELPARIDADATGLRLVVDERRARMGARHLGIGTGEDDGRSVTKKEDRGYVGRGARGHFPPL